MEELEDKMLIAVGFSIDYEKFEDLIVTALEGGINYWADFPDQEYDAIRKWSKNNGISEEPFSKKFSKYIWSGYSVSVIDADEPDDGEIGQISLEIIKNEGWQLFSEQTEHFFDFINDNADAITADVWFQCCSLRGVVYG